MSRRSGALPSVGVSKTVAGSNSIVVNGDMRSNANVATANHENLVHQLHGFSVQTQEIDSHPAHPWMAELSTTSR
jgi:hypothetical protein